MKTKISTKLLFAVLPFSLIGCATKVLLLQSPIVSMSRSDAGEVKKLKIDDEAISEEWCTDDDPVFSSKDKVYGMADQVIYKAQDGGKKADFITDATIYVSSDGCATITGKRARM